MKTVGIIGNPLSNKRNFSSQKLLHPFKNKDTENAFSSGLFAADPLLSMVDVRDVAEAVFQAAVRTNLHGKNYLLANESFKVSDISRMVNGQTSLAGAALTYINELVKKDLKINFVSAADTLKNYVDNHESSSVAGE